MKERPILFSGDMVRAILEGRKTQTRRIMKPQPVENSAFWYPWPETKKSLAYGSHQNFRRSAHEDFGSHRVGDRLWVRETWAHFPDESHFIYRESDEGRVVDACPKSPKGMNKGGVWKPSIHMPKTAARIHLRVKAVRVERLNEISEADAMAEGSFLGRCPCLPSRKDKTPIDRMFQQTGCHIHGEEFKSLWESINGNGSWSVNPWVWVIEFEVAR